MRLRNLSLLLTSLVLLASSASGTGVARPRFWLCGEDPVVQKDKHKSDPADYMDLFRPNAPWAKSASGLSVFKISTQMVLRGTNAQLQTIIDGLKTRHIAMAVEMGLLVGSDSCGKGVEGYGGPSTVQLAAKRIKVLGGQIDYIAMDEPVWFGHIFKKGADGKVGCQYTTSALAAQITPKIAMLRQYFPAIQVGDIEPINARSGGPQSIADIITFEDRLRKDTGIAPAFVDADVSWTAAGWQPLLESLARRLHARGIRVGIICDGDPNAGGNAAWVTQALKRCEAVAADPRIKPDDFIVQTWEPLPTKMLPESDPGALTFEAKQAEERFRRSQN